MLNKQRVWVWVWVSGVGLGWGLRFPPFRYFPNFSTSPKYMLAIEYHVHIWQVSPQLSCGDICQIWMRFKECNRYFCQIEYFAYGEIDERNFSNPHPRVGSILPTGLSCTQPTADKTHNGITLIVDLQYWECSQHVSLFSLHWVYLSFRNWPITCKVFFFQFW